MEKYVYRNNFNYLWVLWDLKEFKKKAEKYDNII